LRVRFTSKTELDVVDFVCRRGKPLGAFGSEIRDNLGEIFTTADDHVIGILPANQAEGRVL